MVGPVLGVGVLLVKVGVGGERGHVELDDDRCSDLLRLKGVVVRAGRGVEEAELLDERRSRRLKEVKVQILCDCLIVLLAGRPLSRLCSLPEREGVKVLATQSSDLTTEREARRTHRKVLVSALDCRVLFANLRCFGPQTARRHASGASPSHSVYSSKV